VFIKGDRAPLLVRTLLAVCRTCHTCHTCSRCCGCAGGAEEEPLVFRNVLGDERVGANRKAGARPVGANVSLFSRAGARLVGADGRIFERMRGEIAEERQGRSGQGRERQGRAGSGQGRGKPCPYILDRISGIFGWIPLIFSTNYF
jgi:hypothetical protein